MLKNSVEVVPLALLVLLVWLSISPSSGSNARQGPPGNNAWTLLADTTNGVSSDMTCFLAEAAPPRRKASRKFIGIDILTNRQYIWNKIHLPAAPQGFITVNGSCLRQIGFHGHQVI